MPADGYTLPDRELSRMLDLLDDQVVRYDVAELRVVYCNAAWSSSFGTTRSAIVGTPLPELLNAEEMAGLHAQLARLGPGVPPLRDTEARRASRGADRDRWVEWVDRYLETPDGPHILAVGRDVTERHLAEERLAASEVLFRSLAEASADLVWRFEGGPAPRLTYLSPSVTTLTGWSVEDLIGPVDGIDAILDDAGRALVRVAASGADLPERFDLRMRRADDSWMILEMQVARLPAGWQGIGRDVTEIRTLQDQLASLALRDPLTGMANRRLLNVLLDTALQRCQRNGTFLVVSYLDLDDFKHVNDEHGHAAGDAVLQQVAQRLLGTVRGSDVVARLGGDEFIAVHEAAPATAPAIVERLSRALSAPYDLPDGHRVSCLPSIGTADSATYTTPAELIAAADGAMYTAKRAHRAGRSRQH